MAIYWTDFHSATNGVGTYANPYNGTALPALVGGDEMRVKSKSVVAMTSGTFTGDFNYNTSAYTITNCSDTSGVSLYSIIMDDVTKVCGLVTTITTNTIGFYSQAGCPVVEPVVTGRTFRIISDPLHRIQHQSAIYIGGGAGANIDATYTDGWENETTRHTDLSYITILSSKISNSQYVYTYGIGHTINMQNTVLLPGGAYAAASISILRQKSDITINFHSITSGNTSGGDKTSATIDNVNINWKYMIEYYGASSSSAPAGDNLHITIETLVVSSGMYMQYQKTTNSSLTITNIVHQSYYIQAPTGAFANFTLTLNGTYWSKSATPPRAFFISFGQIIVFGTNFKVFSAGVETNIINYKTYIDINHDGSSLNLVDIENITNNSVVTFNAGVNRLVCGSNAVKSNPINSIANIPVHDIIVYLDSSTEYVPTYKWTPYARYLFKDVDDSLSFEFLNGNYYTNANYGVRITTDDVIYKTTAPSLKCNLALGGDLSYTPRVKVIQLPVEGNGVTQFTVSCWLKSSTTVLTLLECQVLVDGVLNTTAMSLASVAAGWTEYTYTFTPSKPQIAELRINMQFKASGSFWISDVGLV